MLKKLLTYICMFLVAGIGFFGTITNNHITLNFEQKIYASFDEDPNGIGNAKQTTSTPSSTTPAKAQQDAEMQKMLNGLVAGLNIILDILTIIVTPAMILASWLMSPDWTSGDLFQIRPILHSLWVTIANITYFIYAILLIFIALGTIFNSDKYGYKQLLPKLALGILLVPLTWWFIQFIISLSSIVTASVISIPMETVINYSKENSSSWWTEPSIPKETRFSNEKKDTVKKLCAGSAAAKENNAPGENNTQECISPEKFIEKAGGMYSNLMLYSFAVFRFQDVKILNGGTKDTIKSIGQIVNQGLIGAVMFIVYGLLVLALVFMLMMRAIKLWFYAMFSPLMTLKYVIGDGFFGGKENSDTFELKEFIGLAFVPALVGLALSFGLVIVSVMMGPPPKNSSDKCSETSCEITLFGNSENKILSEVKGNNTETTVSVGGAKYIFSGDVGPGSAVSGVKTALNATGGIIGTIIIDIIALVFIWVAFMAAKNVSKAVKAAVSPFEELGSKIGKFGMSLPKYAPILPGGISISGANQLASGVESKISAASTDKANESALGKMLGMDKKASGESKVQADNFANAVSSKDFNKAGETFKVASTALQKDLNNSKEIKEEVAKMAESLRTLESGERKLVLQKAGFGSDGIEQFERLLRENDGKKIDKNSYKVSEFQSVLIGKSGSKGSTNGTEAINTTVKGDSKNNIFNLSLKGVNVEVKGDTPNTTSLKSAIDKYGKNEVYQKEFSEGLLNSLNSVMKQEDAKKAHATIIQAMKDAEKFKPGTDK